MTEVIYCLASKTNFLSGFNIVATNLFEGFSYGYFGYKNLQNQSKNNYTSNYCIYVLVTIGKILVANHC